MQDLVDIPAAEYLSPSTARTRSAHTKKFRQFSTSTDCFKFEPAHETMVLIAQATSEGSGEPVRILAVSPEPSLFAHMQYGNRRRVRPNSQTSSPTGWLCMRV